MTRRVVDLTIRLGPGTPVYPGDPPLTVETYATHEQSSYYARRVCLGEHTGTHVDAPAHFHPGKPTVDALPPRLLAAPALVVDLRGAPCGGTIGLQQVLEALDSCGRPSPGGGYLLVATGGARCGMEHPAIDGEVALWLAREGALGLGVDLPSPDHPPYPVHKILLGHGLVIIENLVLDGLLEELGGSCRVPLLVVAPLPLEGGSGAPARVLAVLG